MTAEEINRVKQSTTLEAEFERRGHALRKEGKNMVCRCPFHEERTESCKIHIEEQYFKCFGSCQEGGDVIAFVIKADGCTFEEAVQKLSGSALPPPSRKKTAPAPPKRENRPFPREDQISKLYSYENEHGEEVFQCVRYEPKDFRQRHRGPDGSWVWNLQGVQRVVYNLPAVIKSKAVWIVEGEKDAETLISMGLVATTSPMGAGKWMEPFNEWFHGKEVVLCGDNDGAGRKHVDALAKTLETVAKSIRKVKVPDPHKDITDWLGPIADKEARFDALMPVVEKAPAVYGGTELPIYSMAELEQRYIDFQNNPATARFHLSRFLPAFSRLRALVGGETVLLVAGTGVGKTLILQNIAIAAAPLPVLFFEMELPDTLMFERSVSMAANVTAGHVDSTYYMHSTVDWRSNGKLNHLFVCPTSGLTVEQIAKYIRMSELKMGQKPAIVMIDYVGLIKGNGKRYERVSDAAEGLKVVAKETGTIIFMASQVARKGKDDDSVEVSMHDAKESGSLENSAGLVISAWRDKDQPKNLWLKVCKSTKGGAGLRIFCAINSTSLAVTQLQSPTPEE